jgi:hypothetical protein
VYDHQNELGICGRLEVDWYNRAFIIPGTMTSSFFFVLSRNNLTSSSLSNPSTKLPAALINDHTMLATSSALCIPLSFLLFV